MLLASHSVSSWSPIVALIRAGSESGVELLYKSLQPIRFFFGRQIGLDRAEDAYQNLIINLVAAITTDVLQRPESLFAYAMTIARREVCRQVGEVVREKQTLNVECIDRLTCATSESPEQSVLRSERESIAKRVLTALPPRMREILIRFYLTGESEEQIRAAMGISHTEFRLVKSRAKMRYEELVKQSMNRTPNRKPVYGASLGMPSFVGNGVTGKTGAGVSL